MSTLRIAIVAVALLIAGCASVSKVSTGDITVGNRVQMVLDAAWNQVNLPGGKTVMWTQDGVTVDVLQWWVGVREGQELADTPKDKRPLTFRARMEPHEVVALYEGLYSRDGSSFTLDRLSPADFLGGKGYRFEFTVLRKVDDVRVSGVGWATVRDGELHAMTFTAPRLGFFARHLPIVEKAAAAARLKA